MATTRKAKKKSTITSKSTPPKKSTASKKNKPSTPPQDVLLPIEDFFSSYHLKDARHYLDELLEASLTHEYSFQTGKSRSNLLHFEKTLWSLLQAAHQLYVAAEQSISPK